MLSGTKIEGNVVAQGPVSEGSLGEKLRASYILEEEIRCSDDDFNGLVNASGAGG